MSRKVSVVIPTLNSRETLARCLASVKANTNTYQCELIVVDAGSNDGTIETATQYTDKVYHGHPFKINRNIGIECAGGDIVCFTDSDCTVPENWIDGLVAGLTRLNEMDSSIVGVGGGNVPLIENPSFMELMVSKAMRSPLISFRARNVSSYQDEREVLHNPPMNSAYFKSAIKEVGGFGEDNVVGEDVELDAKLVDKGYRLYYLPDVFVYHKHRATFQGFFKRMYEFGKHRIRVGRKYKRYLQFHHYGPVFLCLMTFTPFIAIPLLMGVANGAYVSLKERSALMFVPVAILTMGFYVSYGAGEIAQLVRRGG